MYANHILPIDYLLTTMYNAKIYLMYLLTIIKYFYLLYIVMLFVCHSRKLKMLCYVLMDCYFSLWTKKYVA